MSDLQIQTSEQQDAIVVAIRGDAGAANVSRLERELQRLATQKARLFVFDLAGLTFISSVGLVALVAFERNVERRGGKVLLAAVPNEILDVLNTAKLAKTFRVAPTVEAALRGE